MSTYATCSEALHATRLKCSDRNLTPQQRDACMAEANVSTSTDRVKCANPLTQCVVAGTTSERWYACTGSAPLPDGLRHAIARISEPRRATRRGVNHDTREKLPTGRECSCSGSYTLHPTVRQLASSGMHRFQAHPDAAGDRVRVHRVHQHDPRALGCHLVPRGCVLKRPEAVGVHPLRLFVHSSHERALFLAELFLGIMGCGGRGRFDPGYQVCGLHGTRAPRRCSQPRRKGHHRVSHGSGKVGHAHGAVRG